MFNEETFSLLEQLKVPKKIISLLSTIEKNKSFDEGQMHEILQKYFPNPNKGQLQKRREDASLQTKTEAGTNAKDTMMTFVETCKKHGVSSYKYIFDRVSKTFKLPSLANLIRANAVYKPTGYDSS